MTYQTDIAEIVRFIECGVDTFPSKDVEECVAKFTEATKDELLNERADFILGSLGQNFTLHDAFSKLSSCPLT